MSGNYTTPDPIGLEGGSLSLYSYVNGQPTRLTDPEGLQVRPRPAPFPGPGAPGTAPGSPGEKPLYPDFPGGPTYTPSLPPFTWPELLPDAWVDWIIEKTRAKWSCTASCNVQQIKPDVCCPDRVTGAAIGPNEPAACVALNAMQRNQHLPGVIRVTVNVIAQKNENVSNTNL